MRIFAEVSSRVHLAAALFMLGLFAFSGCAVQDPMICPSCSKHACLGCKHLPDPGTAGYHCTIWTPLIDPCEGIQPFPNPPFCANPSPGSAQTGGDVPPPIPPVHVEGILPPPLP